jgi:hypothetical protein
MEVSVCLVSDNVLREIPLTVPVARTSPGMRVCPSDIVFKRYGILKIKSSVVAF